MMDVLELEDADFVETFERSSSQQKQGRWMITGALGLIAVAAMGFVFCLATDVNLLTLQMLTTLPFMISLGLLTAGWSLSRGATRVTVSRDGLEHDQSGKVVTHPWNDVGWCTLSAIPPSQKRPLVIYDSNGRRLTVLGEAFDDFDRMVAAVKEHIDVGENSIGRIIQLKKARKSALLIAAGSLLCLAASIVLGWSTYEGHFLEDDFLDSPLVGYGMSAMMALAWFVCFGLAVLQWRGWDLDLDSKTGQFSVNRFGEGE